MTTKYFVNQQGKYIGGFSVGNPKIPQGVIEVNSPPSHAINEIWNFKNSQWIKDEPIYLEILKEQLTESRLSYLKNTDYYVIREVDKLEGEPEKVSKYPVEIKERRDLARSQINAIDSAETLEDLKIFNVEFN